MEIVAISGCLLEEGREKVVEPISRVFEGSMEVLLRWLNFWLGSWDWIICYDPRARHGNPLFIPGRTAEIFSNVLGGCDEKLRNAMLALPETTRFGLSLWNWVDQNGLPLYLPHHIPQQTICPIIDIVSSLQRHPATKHLIVEEVSNYTYKQHVRFLHCTLTRIKHWEACRIRSPSKKIHDGSDIVAILLVLTHLLCIPALKREFIRLNVAGQVMRLAASHPEWDVQGPKGTLSIKVASLLFFDAKPWEHYPNYQRFVLPQLIEAGALEAILDDYIS
jgi:hypothetical protein